MVPPSDWEVQSSIREAPAEKAVWAESGVKQAISREGIVKFERLNERAIFSLGRWKRRWNPVITCTGLDLLFQRPGERKCMKRGSR